MVFIMSVLELVEVIIKMINNLMVIMDVILFSGKVVSIWNRIVVELVILFDSLLILLLC